MERGASIMPKLRLRCACVRAREERVRVHARECACNEMDPDMESHHTKRDNQIMIKTKQMAT